MEFTKDVCDKIGFYVYRLIDPRNQATFYVGKGKNNRAFEHAKNALKEFDKDDDECSMKISRIKEIINAKKEVIVMIHRYGLSEKEAFEVESALIDAIPGLTNIQPGHNSDRGAILAEDLQKNLSLDEFRIPESIEYAIFKVSASSLSNSENLYEAARHGWRVDKRKITKVDYALAVMDGVVKEVYKIDRWVTNEKYPNRCDFEGVVAREDVREIFVDHLIPEKYKKKGSSYPVLYK